MARQYELFKYPNITCASKIAYYQYHALFTNLTRRRQKLGQQSLPCSHMNRRFACLEGKRWLMISRFHDIHKTRSQAELRSWLKTWLKRTPPRQKNFLHNKTITSLLCYSWINFWEFNDCLPGYLELFLVLLITQCWENLQHSSVVIG